MKCKYELICADQWKVREWLGDKTRSEQQEKTKLIQEITIILDNIKGSLTKEEFSLDQLTCIKNNLQVV